MKLSTELIEFTDDNVVRKEYYARAYDYFEACRTGVAKRPLHEAMHESMMSEIETVSGHNRDYIERNFTSRTDVKEAFFEVVGALIDSIIPDVLIKDYGWIAEIRNIGWGDSLKFKVKPRDIFLPSKVGKSKRTFDIQQMKAGEKSLVPEWHGFTVGVDYYDVITGKVTLGEFMMAAILGMEMALRYEIFDTFATAMDNLIVLPDWGVTGWTQNSAIELAQRVSAWNGGAPVSFIGTKLALSQVLPASTNAIPYVINEQVSLGYRREFFGIPCVELEQVADYMNFGGVKIPNDRIYVLSNLSDKIVKVVLEGNTIVNNATNTNDFDKANLLMTGTMRKSWATGVITNQFAGTIEL